MANRAPRLLKRLLMATGLVRVPTLAPSPTSTVAGLPGDPLDDRGRLALKGYLSFLETVLDGETGFLLGTTDPGQYAATVPHADKLDRDRISRHAWNFSGSS